MYDPINSDKRVDAINDSDKQVDAINVPEELVDAKRYPTSNTSSDQNISIYATNGKFPQTLLRSRFVPDIIQGTIGPTNQLATEDVTVIQDILGLR